MFGFFEPKGFDGLPDLFVDALEARIGEDDLTLLQALGKQHGLFYQRFFRQPRARYLLIEDQLLRLAELLTSLANQLGHQRRFADAEEFYLLALRIESGLKFAHLGLANLYSTQGNVSKAARHARGALRTMRKSKQEDDGEALQAKAFLAKILAEEHLLKTLSTAELARARDLTGDRKLTPETNRAFGSIVLAIADTEAPQAFADYQALFAEVLFHAANEHALAFTDQSENHHLPTASYVARRNHLDPAMQLLDLAKRLYPEHLDAWILSTNVLGIALTLGANENEKLVTAARGALALLARLENGDTTVYTKDPELRRSGLRQMREHLESAIEDGESGFD